MAQLSNQQVPRTVDFTAPAQIQWFCVRTHPKHEHIATAQLSQIAGVEVYNPQLRLVRRTRRGPVRTIESVFVNYIFARGVLETTLEKVRFTPSVKAVVRFGERVATIPDAVIEELRQTLAEHADTVFTDAPVEGEEAEIARGPFQGEKARITRVLPARERVEVLLNVMGRSLPTEIPLSSIIFRRRTMGPRTLRAAQTESNEPDAVASFSA